MGRWLRYPCAGAKARGAGLSGRSTTLLSALLVLLAAQPVLAGKGRLALVNTGKDGHEVVERAAEVLSDLVGGWAREPGIGALLAGRPNPGALPVGETGRDLVRLVERVRTERLASRKDLSALGKLLGVDYLLLIRARGDGFVARLFSTHRRSHAPRRFEGKAGELSKLRLYVKEEAGRPKRLLDGISGRWWVWIIAGGVAALTVGLALAGGDDTKGDLRIRVSR
jgi:hypothetical protein